jgi:hypothetical protein
MTNPKRGWFVVMSSRRRGGWQGKANEEVPVVKDGHSDVDNVSRPERLAI